MTRTTGVVVAAALMAATLTACGGTGDDASPSPSSNPTVSASPTSNPSPAMGVSVGIPEGKPFTSDVLAAVEPGWVLATFTDRDPIDGGDRDLLPEGAHQVLMLISPEGEMYKVLDLPADQAVSPGVWEAGEPTARMWFRSGHDDWGDISYDFYDIDLLTGEIGAAAPAFFSKVSPAGCETCGFLWAFVDGGEIWIGIPDNRTVEVVIVSDGLENTYTYTTDARASYAHWPTVDPTGRWAIMETTLAEESGGEQILLDEPLKVMDLRTGGISDVASADGDRPHCLDIQWIDDASFRCWTAEPGAIVGYGSGASDGLSIVDVTTGAETRILSWGEGVTPLRPEAGFASGNLEAQDPWRDSPVPVARLTTDDGRLVDVDLHTVFSDGPWPLTDVDVGAVGVGGDVVFLSASNASWLWGRAATLYNPITGETLPIIGWHLEGDGVMVGFTTAQASSEGGD